MFIYSFPRPVTLLVEFEEVDDVLPDPVEAAVRHGGDQPGERDECRDPAFVGFDLACTGSSLCLANWLHLVVVICTVVAFHFRILQEERFLLSRKDIDYKLL